jgi:hypothetical protein
MNLLTNLFNDFDLSFKIQLFCCFYLAGLIWTIQAVHYPAYHFIDISKFSEYQQFHTKWITPVVAPFMIIELLTAITLVISSKNNNFWILNLVGVLILWLVTFLLSVPSHNRLISSYDFKTTQFLILTNWLRTLFWSLRSMGLFYYWIVKF